MGSFWTLFDGFIRFVLSQKQRNMGKQRENVFWTWPEHFKSTPVSRWLLVLTTVIFIDRCCLWRCHEPQKALGN